MLERAGRERDEGRKRHSTTIRTAKFCAIFFLATGRRCRAHKITPKKTHDDAMRAAILFFLAVCVVATLGQRTAVDLWWNCTSSRL